MPDEQLRPDHGHRLPADRLPLPARDRLRRLHARRLPAGAAGGDQLPGHVRAAAGAAGQATQVANGSAPSASSAESARQPAPRRCRMNIDRARRRRLGHGARGPRRPTRHAVTLWARDAQQVAQMRSLRAQRALPAGRCACRPALAGRAATSMRRCATRTGGLVVVATPMAGLRGDAAAPAEHVDAPVVWLCKGFERTAPAWLGHEIAGTRAPRPAGRRAQRPELRARSRARPADGAGRGQRARERARRAGRGASTAPACASNANDDLVGVEVGGAVKNVLAIATGLATAWRSG